MASASPAEFPDVTQRKLCRRRWGLIFSTLHQHTLIPAQKKILSGSLPIASGDWEIHLSLRLGTRETESAASRLSVTD